MKFTKQVKTPLLPEVKEIIDNLSVDLTPRRFKTNIKEWLSPVIDLNNFYVYPINGITEGLNWWAGTSAYKIWKETGEYEWIDNSNTGMSPTTIYQSSPCAIDGNFRDTLHQGPMVLDLAYVGTTKIQKIELHDNVDYIFYGLSKPFGVNFLRTGWMFTKHRQDKLHKLIYQNHYYNYYSTAIAEEIIKHFPIDYIYHKFIDKQLEICEKYDLIPSDSVYIATSEDKQYNEYIRKDIARLCLTEYYA